MPLRLDDTIAAVATAAGGSAEGVVRVAGPDAIACVARCVRTADGADLASLRHSTAIRGEFNLASWQRHVACLLYVWPTQRSYTRSPLVEVHTLGSPPLLDAVLRSLCDQGARVAEPGEFTLRAFLGGRLDLAQAEAVLGVIDADGPRQLGVALAQLSGGLSAPLARLRESLLELLARLEAGLDFVEEDIEFITVEELSGSLIDARDQIEATAEQMQGRSEAAGAPRFVLLGSPNVGKSSLFNRLVEAYGDRTSGEAAAIVSNEPGTTRDYLTARLKLGGMVCDLVDTAGLEPETGKRAESDPGASDQVALSAQRVSQEQHAQADVRILCLDASRALTDAERRRLAGDGGGQLVVWTKRDLAPQAALSANAAATSAASGEGIAELAAAMQRAVDGGGADAAVVASTAARCRQSLLSAAAHLDSAVQLAADADGEELVAAEVRSALEELGCVTGAVYTDDILDRIFSRFCIGK